MNSVIMAAFLLCPAVLDAIQEMMRGFALNRKLKRSGEWKRQTHTVQFVGSRKDSQYPKRRTPLFDSTRSTPKRMPDPTMTGAMTIARKMDLRELRTTSQDARWMRMNCKAPNGIYKGLEIITFS